MNERRCFYSRVDLYDSPEAKLIESEPNPDSTFVILYEFAAYVQARRVDANGDGSFSVVTDAGVLSEAEVLAAINATSHRTSAAKLHAALRVLSMYPPFEYFAYSEEEADQTTPEWVR